MQPVRPVRPAHRKDRSSVPSPQRRRPPAARGRQELRADVRRGPRRRRRASDQGRSRRRRPGRRPLSDRRRRGRPPQPPSPASRRHNLFGARRSAPPSRPARARVPGATIRRRHQRGRGSQCLPTVQAHPRGRAATSTFPRRWRRVPRPRRLERPSDRGDRTARDGHIHRRCPWRRARLSCLTWSHSRCRALPGSRVTALRHLMDHSGTNQSTWDRKAFNRSDLASVNS